MPILPNEKKALNALRTKLLEGISRRFSISNSHFGIMCQPQTHPDTVILLYRAGTDVHRQSVRLAQPNR